jgi:hypothetical protein
MIHFKNVDNYHVSPKAFTLTTSGKDISVTYSTDTDPVWISPTHKVYYGKIVIPKEDCPEANGNAIPIYVPGVIDNSNAIREEGDWKNVRTISKNLAVFDWLAFTTGTITGTTPYEEDPYKGEAEDLNTNHNAVAASAEFFSAIANSANSATQTFDIDIRACLKIQPDLTIGKGLNI